MGGGGRREQGIGVRQPVLLGQQRGVLAFTGADLLDVSQGPAQFGGFGGPLPRPAGQLVKLGPDVPVPVIGPLVVGQHGVQGRPGEPVQRLALPARLSSCC